MGEHKRKTSKPVLTDIQRAQYLGADPFTASYDLIFDMIHSVFTNTGGVLHELIGIDFEAGKPIGVNVLTIHRVEDVPHLRTQMLERWPMVAHVCEAWEAPDQSAPPHAHPLRYDIVSVMLHTTDMAAMASCRVDIDKKTIQRAELFFPTHVGGRLGVQLPQRH